MAQQYARLCAQSVDARMLMLAHSAHIPDARMLAVCSISLMRTCAQYVAIPNTGRSAYDVLVRRPGVSLP
jgi:hypothetical protein